MPVVRSRFTLYDHAADLKARRALPWKSLPGRRLVEGPTREEYERVRSYLRASRAITEQRTRLLDSVFSLELEPDATVRPLERRLITTVRRVWEDLFETHLRNSSRLAEAFQAAAVAGRLPSNSLLELVRNLAQARGIPLMPALLKGKGSRSRARAIGGSDRINSSTATAVADRPQKGASAGGQGLGVDSENDQAVEGQVLLGRSILIIHHCLNRLDLHGADVALVRKGTDQNVQAFFQICSTPVAKFYAKAGYSRSRHETQLEGPACCMDYVTRLGSAMQQTGLRSRMLERFVSSGEDQWTGGETCIRLGPKEIASLSRELEAIDAKAWSTIRSLAYDRKDLDAWEEFLRGMWSLLPRASASGKVLHVYWSKN